MGAAGHSWLGVLLGTRLWYAFWECNELNDGAKFDQRVDAVCREIGSRGRGRSALQALEDSLSPPPSPALGEQEEEMSCQPSR